MKIFEKEKQVLDAPAWKWVDESVLAYEALGSDGRWMRVGIFDDFALLVKHDSDSLKGHKYCKSRDFRHKKFHFFILLYNEGTVPLL